MNRYAKGAAKERMLKQALEALGWYVCRSAGSKGVFDLVAIKRGRAIGIQVKIGNGIEKSELKRLRATARLFKIPVFLFIWGKNKNKKWSVVQIGNRKLPTDLMQEVLSFEGNQNSSK